MLGSSGHINRECLNDVDRLFNAIGDEKQILAEWFPQTPAESFANLLTRLTPTQCQILRHYIHFPCDKRVAKEMGLSQSTVSNQMRSIEKRLGVSSRPELVQFVLVAVLRATHGIQ